MFHAASRAPVRSALALGASALLASACDQVRTVAGQTPLCMRCHGGASGNAAPPRSVRGETDTSVPAVGAHQAHLVAGNLRGPIACDECHKVPTAEDWRTHLGGNASVEFVGTLGRSGGATPSFDFATLRCSGTYCHGGTLGDPRATVIAPAWTVVDGTQRACGSCHGIPPAQVRMKGQLFDHPQGGTDSKWCHFCHSDTVDANGAIDIAGGHHIDGRYDVAVGGDCNGCHQAPPPTGAHLAHANPLAPPTAYGDVHTLQDVVGSNASFTSYTSYDFGCGNCHPIDPTSHMTGGVDLSPAGAPAGSLKARNGPNAQYDPATGTCSGVYCHSTGQEAPAYRTTPSWISGTKLACDGCHADPPRYASGTAGAPDANSHLVLASDGYESGHFGGLPGPWHRSKHGLSPGTTDAAPITCQTCHAETVDPANTGPSGFYYLDTAGSYDLGGSLGYACARSSCHGPGSATAPEQGGKALPLRHVNGRRDVMFDTRTALPGLAWLPPAPNTPTRPIWSAPAGVTPPVGDAVFEGTTLSMDLSKARYDAATKTCSSVPCHLFETQVQWGGANGWDACSRCHGF
jgi:predicted CxxxxCH...CXXCH cytochrome family protein